MRVNGLDEELNNLAVEVLNTSKETIEIIQNVGEAFQLETLRFVIMVDVFAKTLSNGADFKEKVKF
jgi:hypothetical protein